MAERPGLKTPNRKVAGSNPILHNLYIICINAFQFFTCKVRVGAFNLLYTKLLLAKLCLFVFGATFVASHRQFISMGCFVCN